MPIAAIISTAGKRLGSNRVADYDDTSCIDNHHIYIFPCQPEGSYTLPLSDLLHKPWAHASLSFST